MIFLLLLKNHTFYSLHIIDQKFILYMEHTPQILNLHFQQKIHEIMPIPPHILQSYSCTEEDVKLKGQELQIDILILDVIQLLL